MLPPNSRENGSRMDKIRESLYSRTGAPIARKRITSIHKENSESVPQDWQHEEPLTQTLGQDNSRYTTHMSFLTKILIGAVVFFIGSLGVGAVIFFQGGNIVSAENVDIAITAPISINGGDAVTMDINVINRNNVLLEAVDLIVTFPSGVADPVTTTKELKEYRKILPDIEPGRSAEHSVQAVVYGQENTSKDINVRVEYRVKGSNAVFRKEKTYALLLTSSPLSLQVNGPQEVYAGQEVEYAFLITSNSRQPLKNLLLKLSYPTGFSYTTSDVKPVYDNATWKIGDMTPGSRRVVKIKGVWQGQNEDERVIKASIGTQSTKSDRQIGTEFVGTQYAIQISKPFLALDISLEGDRSGADYIGIINDSISGEINWFNNLDTAVSQGEIRLKLVGNAFDKYSISPDQGLFKSETNEIVWNTQTNRELTNIGAGEGGRVTFRIIPRDLSKLNAPVANPQITLSASAKGNRNSETNVVSSLESTARRVIKVSSNLSLATGSYRKEGPFTNTGPFPPKAEQVSTYTIVFKIYNTANALSGTTLTATLPPYVSWLGKVAPATDSITYSKLDGKLVWNIGSVPAYTGTSQPPREIAFQVALEPTVNQIGVAANLVQDIAISGRDSFTGAEISLERAPVTTLISDSNTREADSKIQQ